jgi:hypothetical protein
LAGTHPQIQATRFQSGIPSKQDRQVLGRSMVRFSLSRVPILLSVSIASTSSSLTRLALRTPLTFPCPLLFHLPLILSFSSLLSPLLSSPRSLVLATFSLTTPCLTGAFRRVWVTWRYNVAGSYILPINFYNYVDMSGTDESKWRILRVRFLPSPCLVRSTPWLLYDALLYTLRPNLYFGHPLPFLYALCLHLSLTTLFVHSPHSRRLKRITER